MSEGTFLRDTLVIQQGSFGVGLTSLPSYKLHVAGNSYIDATAGSPTLLLGRYSGNPSIKAATDDSGYLIMDSSGAGTGRAALNWYSSDHIVLAHGGGNVGIVQTSPVTKLHIAVNNNSVHAPTSYTNNGVKALTLRTQEGDGLEWHLAHSTNGYTGWVAAARVNNTGGNWGNGYLEFTTAGSSSGAGNANVLVLAGTGRIGMGTASPARKLDLTAAGQMTFGDGVTGDYNQGIYWHSGNTYGIYKTSGSWSSPDYQQLQIRFATGIILHPGSGAYGRSHVGVVGGVSIGSTYFSTMEDNGLIVEGNVGIGTTSPSEKLHLYTNGSGAPNLVLQSNASAGQEGGGILFKNTTNYYDLASIKVDTDTYTNRGDLVFATANTSTPIEAVRILGANQNVGIGTDSPDYELEVSTSSNSRIAATSVTNSVVNHLQADSSGGYVGPLSNHSLFIKTNNTTKMTILSGGNVGISTTSPRTRLDLGNNGISHLRWGTWSELGEESSHNSLVIGNNVYVDGSATKVRATSVDGYRAIKMKYSEGMTFHTTDASVTADDALGNERMRITTGGSVGVGLTTPLTNSLMTVNGGFAVGNSSYGSDMNTGRADFSVDCNGSPQIVWLGDYIQVGGTDQNWSMKASTGLIQTWSQNLQLIAGGTGTYRLYLGTSNNNVTATVYNSNFGLGTTTPTEKLHVVGNIAISSTSYKIGYRDGTAMDVYIQFDDNNPSYSIAGTTYSTGGGFKVVADKSTADDGNSFVTTEVLDVHGITAIDGEFSDDLKVTGSIGVGGNLTTSRVVTITNISSTERPAIKIVNPNFSSNTSSTGKSFYRWLPIDIDGTTRWIAIYQ